MGTQKPGVGLHLHSPCNQGLMQAWRSTHCLSAVNAHPPPRRADPKPESSDLGDLCCSCRSLGASAPRNQPPLVTQGGADGCPHSPALSGDDSKPRPPVSPKQN